MGVSAQVGAGRGPPSASQLNGSILDQRRSGERLGREGKEMRGGKGGRCGEKHSWMQEVVMSPGEREMGLGDRQ